ncbi:hypothetical protein AURDEDRAFT_169311 [Auricularia subglabra TFB-10046 SS5]|nr:hypothetical protein AURDEDRAFT_169311 [Auricularia subglabra TFB-10046 SS5]
MRSGSQLFVTIEMPSLMPSTGQHTDSASPLTPNDFEDLSWPEDVTPVPTLPEFIHIELPKPTAAEKTHTKGDKPRFLHGRSPLALAKPLLPEDIKPAPAVEARTARVLQLICEERRAGALVRLERYATRKSNLAPRANWATLKVDPPAEPRTPVVHAKVRVHSTEKPLARRTHAMIELEKKYLEHRLLELSLDD